MLVALALVLGATRSPSVSAQAGAGDPLAGMQVFAKAGCAGCHTLAASGAKGQIGPNLDQLQPDFAMVVAQVTNGGGGMPPFKSILTGQQIADVAAYVSEASRGWRPPSGPANPPGGPAGQTGSAGAPASQSPTSSAPASAPATVKVALREWRLTPTLRRVGARKVTFVVRNAGRLRHQFVLLRTDRPVGALPMRGNRVIEIGRQAKAVVLLGKTSRLTLSLQPGRYLLLCNRPRHFRAGVFSSLRVLDEPSPSATAPGTPPPPVTNEPPLIPPAPIPILPTDIPQDTPSAFKVYCGGCHTMSAAGTTGTVGPNLDVKQPTYARAVDRITNGDADGMPSFASVLTAQQIADIANYVVASTGGRPKPEDSPVPEDSPGHP